MITVDQALATLLDLMAPLEHESVPLQQAGGRVLTRPVVAARAQPPFASSAMDGYAVRNAEVREGARFRLIGEAAAGHAFGGALAPGEAVRIFTGAPLPQGADRVLIQEDIAVTGNEIELKPGFDTAVYVRPAGGDFPVGAQIDAPRRLGFSDIALAASMNCARVDVARRPTVALIATGDELVMPGEDPRDDQIIASNTFGLKAMLEAEGARARLLPIARDNAASLRTVFDLARGSDLIITIGGASVGDHDLVGPVAREMGMEQAFYKVAMRPGKPLMAGRLNGTPMVGLPGNPVSSLVCGQVFLIPMLRAMLGLGKSAMPRSSGVLGVDLAPNGPREHYMRAQFDGDGRVAPFERQDSSLLRVLASASVLLRRPAGDPARAKGSPVEFIPISSRY